MVWYRGSRMIALKRKILNRRETGLSFPSSCVAFDRAGRSLLSLASSSPSINSDPVRPLAILQDQFVNVVPAENAPPGPKGFISAVNFLISHGTLAAITFHYKPHLQPWNAILTSIAKVSRLYGIHPQIGESKGSFQSRKGVKMPEKGLR